MAKNFKVGEAPWELEQQAPAPQDAAVPSSFKAGQAPWEVGQQQALPPTPAQTDNFSSAESALQGFGQGAGFGYVPELQAGTEWALDRVLPQFMGGGRRTSYMDNLRQWREREKAIQAEDPLAYGAGAVGGALTIPMPGVALAKGGTALARVGKAALGGAGMGLVMNPGETEDQFKARLEQAALGGVVSGGMGAVGQGLTKAAGTFKKGREALAMKLAGGRKAHMKEIPAGTPQREKLVGFMEKEGMTKPGSSYEKVLEKSTEIADATGKKLGDLYKGVTDDIAKVAKENPQAAKVLDDTRLNARRVAANILRNAKKELKGTSGGQDAIRFLRKEINNLADIDKTKIKSGFEMVGMSKPQTTGGLPVPVSRVPGVPGQIPPAGQAAGDVIEMANVTRFTQETPFDKLLRYRQSLDDNINYQKKFSESTGNEKALKIARKTVDDMLDKRIATLDKYAGTKRAKELKPLKERYGQAKTLQRISKDRVAGEESKVNLGLLETIAGTGIAGSQIAQGQSPGEALTKGLVGGLALRQARKYGPGMTYSAMRASEKGLGQVGRGIEAIPGQSVFAPWMLMRENK